MDQHESVKRFELMNLKGTKLAEQLFSQIIGMKTTRAKLGYGSFITMDWGRDITTYKKTKKRNYTFTFGEWHLWIYMCAWRLEQNNKPIVGANDERELISENISILSGKALTHVTIKNDSFDTLLQFEDNFQLLLFSFGVEDDEQWMLYTPQNKTFTAGPELVGNMKTLQNKSKNTLFD